jgi:hypothetical protein
MAEANSKAAMEMSVGTIVTIVLLMTVLILGLVLVRTIFKSSVENIEGIDTAVKAEIQKLFAEDENKKIVVYPSTREVVIKKGEDSRGFGISIRNTGDTTEKFSYEIKAQETSCDMQLAKADELIVLNKERNNIVIPAGSIMEDPIFVKFNIPDTAPPCKIVYTIDMERGTEVYGSSTDVYLTIKSE